MRIELKNHSVFRCYIALARSESYQPKRWTRADAIRDVADLNEERALSRVEWFADERIERLIQEHRGMTPDQQFDLGIVAVPRRLANELICEKLVNVFGMETVSQTPGFDEKGRLCIDKRKDFIFPVRKGKLIERFAFYTLREMQEWNKKAA